MATQETDLEIDHSYTIKEAAAAVGRSELTIRRRIEKGRFPQAELQRGSSGDEWRIPAQDLAQVAKEDGWVIDLTESEGQSQDLSTDDLIAAVEAQVRAESKIDLLSKDVQSLTDQLESTQRERDQARNDLEYTQAELSQIEQQLAEQTTAAEVATARSEELRERAEFAEKVRDQSAQERDSLDQKYLELQSRSQPPQLISTLQ